MLIFASVAALRLSSEWGMSYAALIPYATPGFIAFGLCAIPAGWLADRWSREGMMIVFFIGIGVSSILAGLADSPLQIAASLALIGIFADDDAGLQNLLIADLATAQEWFDSVGHLSRIDVKAGDEVAQGSTLGLSGATGLAGGDHLHFAVLVGDSYVDPLEWWDPKWVATHVTPKLATQTP